MTAADLDTALANLNRTWALFEAAEPTEYLNIGWSAQCDPLFLCLAACIILTIITYLHSVALKLTFLVDRMWSLLPIFYLSVFAAWPFFSSAVTHPRLVIQCVIVFCWGLRLTYNFARKGGYNGHEEDYRWAYIRKWQIMQFGVINQSFNLFFYAAYQHVLLLLLTTPAYLSYLNRHSSPELNSIDLLAAGGAVFFLLGETLADQQQWTFQTKKYALRNAGKPLKGDYARGFLTKGLFSLTRHPNFFCEISFWYCNYLFGVAATGQWVNWTLMGATNLNMLFIGSTWFTELISCGKYPEYLRYQKTTSKLLPWFPGASLDDSAKKAE